MDNFVDIVYNWDVSEFACGRISRGLTTDLLAPFPSGGVLASTWVLKLKEHVGALEVLVKNEQTVVGNDYALAA